MPNVGRVVHGQPDGKDDVDGSYHLDSESPKVHWPNDVNEDEGNAGKDPQTDSDVTDEQQRDDEHRGEGQPEIPDQLSVDDLKDTISYIVEKVFLALTNQSPQFWIDQLWLVHYYTDKKYRGFANHVALTNLNLRLPILWRQRSVDLEI